MNTYDKFSSLHLKIYNLPQVEVIIILISLATWLQFF